MGVIAPVEHSASKCNGRGRVGSDSGVGRDSVIGDSTGIGSSTKRKKAKYMSQKTKGLNRQGKRDE